MMVYDFKYDDLSVIVYNTLLKNANAYKTPPQFCLINFDDLSRSHRCNPLKASTMFDITDATEASRTLMLGLNREWQTKQGDFFVESPINFLTAIIWYLKKYQNGKFCTLPHVIELMQEEYTSLFPVLRSEPEIEVLINPFISAYQNDAMEQLEGQVASAKIAMARLSSPQLYWVLSYSDFTLDVNNPDEPKVVCLSSNPQKQLILGAVISLYFERALKLLNKKNQNKCGIVIDEAATLTILGLDSCIATARSNKLSICLGLQNFSQLKKDYGADEAAVIMNIMGNIISGQNVGESAKHLSDMFGKIMQEKESITLNRDSTSITKSGHLDAAIPPSRIANLSSGEFVGIVADNPDQIIKRKMFHAKIINDIETLKAEEKGFKKVPVIREVTQQQIMDNYYQIKNDVRNIIDSEVTRLKKEKRGGELIERRRKGKK